jgi:hypothetical protein
MKRNGERGFNAEKQRCRVTQRKSEVLWGMENARIFLTETLFSLPLCVSAIKKNPRHYRI